MSKFDKETQKSVRVVLPLKMYDAVKDKCLDYGDMSRLVRHLLREWLKNPKATIRQVYDQEAKVEANGESKVSEEGLIRNEVCEKHNLVKCGVCFPEYDAH